MSHSRLTLVSLCIAVLLALSLGCSEEEKKKARKAVNKAKGQVTDTANKTVEKGKEAVASGTASTQRPMGRRPANGIAINVEKSIKSSTCNARQLDQIQRLPSKVRIDSYDDYDSARYPKIMIMLDMPGGYKALRLDQNLYGDMFVATAADSIWSVAEGERVTLKVTHFSTNGFAGNLSGSLVDTINNKKAPLSGTISGAWVPVK